MMTPQSFSIRAVAIIRGHFWTLVFVGLTSPSIAQRFSSPLANHSVNSWFDHTAPLYCCQKPAPSQCGLITIYNGTTASTTCCSICSPDLADDPPNQCLTGITFSTSCIGSLYPYDGHDGIDLQAVEDTDVFAVDDGVVCATDDIDDSPAGIWIRIRHPASKLVSFYGHLNSVLVSPGNTVTRGTHIGESGDTGLVTNPHLHFGVSADCGSLQRDIDPYGWVGVASDDPWKENEKFWYLWAKNPPSFCEGIALNSLGQPAFYLGDLVIGAGNAGKMLWKGSYGRTKGALDSFQDGPIVGMAFDTTTGVLYAANFSNPVGSGGVVTSFDPWGMPLPMGVFNTGEPWPHSLVLDHVSGSTLIYVGHSFQPGNIRRFDVLGNCLAVFDVPTGSGGVIGMALKDDHCTMFYGTEPSMLPCPPDCGEIRKFTVCSTPVVTCPTPSTPPTDFVAAVPQVESIAVLPDGDLIVSARFDIRRLSAVDGSVVQTYDDPDDPNDPTDPFENQWGPAVLDEDGLSFWCIGVSSGNVHRFEIATGKSRVSWNVGTPPGDPMGLWRGLAVFRGPCQ
jgi:peptidase M23-like protein